MKKVKLFTTIASLCLAVALMAFGVYAATLPSLTVGGNISFTATAADGYWSSLTVTVTGGTFTCTGVDSATTTNTWTAVIGDDNKWTVADSLANVSDIAVVVDEGLNACSVKIQATFKNIGSTNDVDLSVDKTDADLGAGITVGTLGEGESATATATAGNTATVTIIFDFAAVDTAQDQTAEAFAALFTATQAE